ncbi:2-C-methyl-D-erythritol 4-phosphate cytidylyltransferase [Mycobacterium yunnanensis]|uniref:2-C-methyl-D-erythritol 4-phosphate cytidylyltransferase n=1 Tax=Mycobacterium yunnanensis TaxID=368477 RepID=A0A9X3C585_9MYCO|nr:IspD/TarI family cytidylyltransferase [Mycobacterium yunnanensis]MCV7424252.1 2-C-methyl-D-erythritol 4-phosphate cytidylyltransferase [Mycobacterium yunnanensis]
MQAAVGVVLAAGMGTRVGADGNKAYLPLAGRSMVSWSVEAVARATTVTRTILVYRRGERALAAATIAAEVPHVEVELVEGGDTRHGSEENVLHHLAPDIQTGAVDVVLVHDAARPLATPAMMDTAVTTARDLGGAIPVLPASDVVAVDAQGRPSVPDGTLVRVQTPQAFRARPLLAAYLAATGGSFDGTDTASCVQNYTDVEVHVFPGASTNLKVTFAADVRLAERLLRDRISRADSR